MTEEHKTLIYLANKLIGDGLDFRPLNANFAIQLGRVAAHVSEGKTLDEAISIVDNAS